MGDVGKAVTLVNHLDADQANAVHDGPTDSPVRHGFEQNGEAPDVPSLGHNTPKGHTVLEGIGMVDGFDDRAGYAQHIETLAVRPAFVANGDDAGLADFAFTVAPGVERTLLCVAGHVDEGVVRLRRDDEWIAGPNFFHGSRSLPKGFRL